MTAITTEVQVPSTADLADQQYRTGHAHGLADATANLTTAINRAVALEDIAYASPWTSGYVTAVYIASLRRSYNLPGGTQ